MSTFPKLGKRKLHSFKVYTEAPHTTLKNTKKFYKSTSFYKISRLPVLVKRWPENYGYWTKTEQVRLSTKCQEPSTVFKYVCQVLFPSNIQVHIARWFKYMRRNTFFILSMIVRRSNMTYQFVWPNVSPGENSFLPSNLTCVALIDVQYWDDPRRCVDNVLLIMKSNFTQYVLNTEPTVEVASKKLARQ